MITREKIEHHIAHLEMLHKDLKLDLMEADLLGDDVKSKEIKKEKLRIKDEIENFKSQLKTL